MKCGDMGYFYKRASCGIMIRFKESDKLMRIRSPYDLVALNLAAILLVIVIVFARNEVLRTVLGLPVAIFSPGYTLLAALFPARQPLDKIERIVLSFGLSIVISALIGMALNYTPLGIKPLPVLACLSVFMLISSGVAWYKERYLSESERRAIYFAFSLPAWGGSTGKLLSVLLGLLILASAVTVGYMIENRGSREKYTEFYLLNPAGRAGEYPRELAVGQKAPLTIVVVNHELEAVTYQITVTADDSLLSETGSLNVISGEKWVGSVSIQLLKPETKQRVQFILYREGQPYRELDLWIDVG